MEFEPVIGLEVHVELKTASKIFCGCKTTFGAPPNTQVCPVCLGLPGVLPVLNVKAVEYAVRIGLALDCEIAPFSKMDRKNYYYPDLPKAYQISQYDLPLCKNGYLEITGENGETKRVSIIRAHLEEDAGKLVHAGGAGGRLHAAEYSLVDYNRSGVPLVEIVSGPDLRSAEEAYRYLQQLKNILMYIEVSDCNMEEGSLRCDANVSVRPKGSGTFGVKTEIKNMNSFRFTRQAIDYEIKRQIALLQKGEKIVQESRLWDTEAQKTRPMRSKEEAHDYRYFPEPDLPPIVLEESFLEKVRASLPELPKARRGRFVRQYGLPDYDAGVLTADKAFADFFEKAAEKTKEYKALSNWMMGDLSALMKEASVEIADLKITPDNLAGMVELIAQGKISTKQGKDLLVEMFQSGKDPNRIVEEKGMVQVSDDGILQRWVAEVLAENPKVVQQFQEGKQGVLGFLVGQVMKKSAGKANPKRVNELLREKLQG